MIKKKLVFKNSKSQKLVGILYSPDKLKKFPIAILCHGYRSTKNNSNALLFSKNITDEGIGFFAFDFSGRGESEGKFEDTTISQYIDDLNCCFDFISGIANKISFIGESLGGFVALNASINNSKVNSMVLLSPVSHFPPKTTGEYSDIDEWKKNGHAFTVSKRAGKLKINYSFYKDGLKYNNYSRYKKIKIPVLVFNGDKDSSVKIEDSIKLNKYLKNSKLIRLKGADHNYTTKKDYEKVAKKTADFLALNLK
jgi:hypothetical protein